MIDAKQRRFDVVAVWKIDRFGRSLKHLVNSLAELESLGIAFVSLKDSLDLTTASGRLLFQLVAAMAEFEHNLIQERVRAGIRNARNKGRRLGRPRLEVDSAQDQPSKSVWCVTKGHFPTAWDFCRQRPPCPCVFQKPLGQPLPRPRQTIDGPAPDLGSWAFQKLVVSGQVELVSTPVFRQLCAAQPRSEWYKR